ncbi:MAG: hypothetical protein EPO68_07415 [Planctomycetota bacterium]|nr:MAG: hypothetical protein EPO68_07415 [Planctomycetota bacterium]
MRKQRTGKWRWIVACVALTPVLVGAVMLSSLWTRGYWSCEICGTSERRTVLVGVPVWWERESEPRGAHAQWWAKEVGIEHDHLWLPIGCQHVGYSTRALLGHQQLYLQQLVDPELPDATLRVAALTLAHASGTERGELINALRELLETNRREHPETAAARIAALRANSPAWDRALAASEAPGSR